MKYLRASLWVSALLLPICAAAADPVVERLDLLERRVSRVTDLTLQLDQVQAENRKLRGEIERLDYEIEQLKRKQRDIYLDIDQRLSALQPGGAAPDAAPAAAATPPPADAAPTGSPVSSANVDRKQVKAEYEAALALLDPQQRRYDEAAKAFQAFLKNYPNDELAPNAQYWLGEAFYVSQQNPEVLAAFQAVLSGPADSNKMAGALYKIGRLQQASGDKAAARASYERVVSDYPNASAAGLARQQLDQLGR